MGTHFDHKQEYRRAWLFYAIACFLVIFAVVGFFLHRSLLLKEPIIYSSIALAVLHMTPSLAILISFTIWLSNIHKRMVLMNLLLRFLILFKLKIGIFLTDYSITFLRLFFCSWTRNYFSQGNKLNESVHEYKDKERSIRGIKLMSRQFLQLTDIINQLNSCYSIKVIILNH